MYRRWVAMGAGVGTSEGYDEGAIESKHPIDPMSDGVHLIWYLKLR